MTRLFSSHYEEIMCLLEEERARVERALANGEGSVSAAARGRSRTVRPPALTLLHPSGSYDSPRAEGLTADRSHVPVRGETFPDEAA